jgi:hypothetical protein
VSEQSSYAGSNGIGSDVSAARGLRLRWTDALCEFFIDEIDHPSRLGPGTTLSVGGENRAARNEKTRVHASAAAEES